MMGYFANSDGDRSGGADAADLFLQQLFNLSDSTREDELYDLRVTRGFVGIGLDRE